METAKYNLNIQRLIEDTFRGEKTLNALNIYSKGLINKNLPIILSKDHLASLLGHPLNLINNVIYSPESFYRSFYIPKKNNNGKRVIHAPKGILLDLQQKIYEYILSAIPVHEKATGYVANKTIKDNAIPHLNTNEILKVDLKDFFPSINFNRVINVFLKAGYTRDISFSLARICTLHNSLPQGAPTSPILSNLIIKRLDIRLEKLSKKLKLNYTRYADDLTFSGDSITISFLHYVKSIINSEGFKVNKKKLRILRKSHKKVITGISITNNELKVPREKKRIVRQAVYFIKKHGFLNHLEHIDRFDPIMLEKLLGYAYYWKFIEDSESSKSIISVLKLEIAKLNSSTSNLHTHLEFVK